MGWVAMSEQTVASWMVRLPKKVLSGCQCFDGGTGGEYELDERFTVSRTVVGEPDGIDKSSWVYGCGQFGDLLQSIRVVGIAETMPYEERDLF